MSKWTIKPLKQLGKFLQGMAFPLQYQGEIDGSMPFYKVSDLNNEGNELFLNNSNNYITEKTSSKLGYSAIPQGSIIFAKIGAAVMLERKRISRTSCFIDNNMGAFYRNNQLDVDYIFQWFLSKNISTLVETTALPALSLKQLELMSCYYPINTEEQRKIAEVLSTVDEAIEKTIAIIEKYTSIKRGLMQELLSQGVKTTLNKCLKVCHGKSQKLVEDVQGQYQILGSGGLMGMAKVYLCNQPSVLIGRKGTIDAPQYMETPFWTIDTLYYTNILHGYCAKYFYYIFQTIDWYKYNEATGVPSLSSSTIGNIEVTVIKDIKKQKEIAEHLTIVDEKITTERNYLTKLQNLKKGLMQDLLTNKVSVEKLLKEEAI